MIYQCVTLNTKHQCVYYSLVTHIKNTIRIVIMALTSQNTQYQHKPLMTLPTALKLSAALITSAFITSNAIAKDYKVEVLVFENLNSSTATESHAYVAPKRMKTGSSAWSIPKTMLNGAAASIENSGEYVLRQHYSWGIESLPYEESANFNVVETDSHGYIKVYAEQLLFTNIDIDYKGFRLKENRRLKLNEKHFFDHPKFGLLMQVSRLEKPTEEDLETDLEDQ